MIHLGLKFYMSVLFCCLGLGTTTVFAEIQSADEKAARLERIQEIRQEIRENTRLVQESPAPVDRKRLEDEFPGLQRSIDTFLDSMRVILSEQVDHQAVDPLVDAMEEQLFRIAVLVDEFHLKKRFSFDPSPRVAQTLNEEGKKRYFLTEDTYKRIELLFSLFFTVVAEIEGAQENQDNEKTEALAGEALRVIAEIYLIAGMTKGSIGEKRFYSGLASLVSSLSLSIASLAVDSLIARGVICGLAILIGFDFILKVSRNEERRYEPDRWFFPGVDSWVKKRSVLSVLALLPQELRTRFLVDTGASADSTEWEKYLLDTTAQYDHPERMIRVVEIASGRSIIDLLRSPDCSYLLSRSSS